MTCAGCGTVAQARSGTWTAPLCAKCTNPDPDFWGRCPVCTTTWQLSPRTCQRCLLGQRVHDLIGDNTGTVRGDLAPFCQAVSTAERPDTALVWLSGSKVRALLHRIGRDDRPITHDVLDEFPGGKTLAHLRSVLVATGALPPRDERLVAVERWITATVQARTDPTQRRIMHGYAVGAEILHEPRLWPEYGPGYYAVFIRDPAGNNLELKCDASTARPTLSTQPITPARPSQPTDPDTTEEHAS